MKTPRFKHTLLLYLLLCLLPVTLLAEPGSGPGAAEERRHGLTLLNTEEMEAIFAGGLLQKEACFTAAQWTYPGKIILWDEGDVMNGARCFSNRVIIKN